jgi:hypothetical protein
VVEAYKDLLADILNNLTNSGYVSEIQDSQGTALTVPTTDDEILTLINRLTNSTLATDTKVNALIGKNFTLTVQTVTDESYSYTVAFHKCVSGYTIDEIISGGIENVNRNMANTEGKDGQKYAELSELDGNRNVTVTIYNGTLQVTKVYTDIIDTLLDALKNNTESAASISIGTASLTVDESVTPEKIEAFVKASGLVDDPNKPYSETNQVKGSTTLNRLYGQKFTATVRTTCQDANESYDYVVTFKASGT